MEKVENWNEDREQQGEKLVDFLHRINAFEFFQKLKNDPELSESVNFEDFKDFLIRINGIIRDIRISEREFDGDGVGLGGLTGDRALVPKQEDKEELLHKAFSARLYLKYPEDIAYILPCIITAVHTFADGNGRTIHVMYLLLAKDSSPEVIDDDLRTALDKNGRSDSFDINPSYINSAIRNVILKKYGIVKHQFPEGLTRHRTNENPQSEEAKIFFNIFNTESEFCFIAMCEYLKSTGKFASVVKTKDDFPDFDLEENYKAISPSKMESVLTQDEWANLLNEYYKIKRESVEVLLDIFVNPDDYKLDNSDLTLRDQLISKVRQNLLDNQL